VVGPGFTGWRTKCHTIDCARNKFLLLQTHLTPGTELNLIGWKIVPNEEHVAALHFLASKWRPGNVAQGPHSEVVPHTF